jgi:CheY-like chemotaxis protein
MTVLHGDDDIEDIEIFLDLIRAIDPSIKCIDVYNGADVLETLENSVLLPDYIFLDLNMPVMSGKVCLKYIKSDERLCHIPVVMLSASNNINDIEYCKELGADYILKPNTLKEAIEKLSKFFPVEISK